MDYKDMDEETREKESVNRLNTVQKNTTLYVL